MATYPEARKQALKLFTRAMLIAHELDDAQMGQRLAKVQKHLREGKLMVVVCGRVDRGKSKLINALLEEPGLLPDERPLTTNLISCITYRHPNEAIKVILQSEKKEQPIDDEDDEAWAEEEEEESLPIQRHQIAKYVTEQENKQNWRRARMLIIETPNPFLRKGLTLVDTPGIGGLHTWHTEVTLQFLQLADMILFVTDGALSSIEKDFIEHHILPFCKNILFVLTKRDGQDDGGNVLLLKNRRRLGAILDQRRDQIPIITVSSKLKLDSLSSGKASYLAKSNFLELEDRVQQMAGKHQGAQLLVGDLRKLEQMLDQMELRLQALHSRYSLESLSQQKQQEVTTQQYLDNLRELVAQGAQWQNEIRQGIQHLQEQARREIDTLYRDVHERTRFLRERRQVNDLLTYIAGQNRALDDRLLVGIEQFTNQLQASADIHRDVFSWPALERHFAGLVSSQPPAREAWRAQARQMERESFITSLRAGRTAALIGEGAGLASSFFFPTGPLSGYVISRLVSTSVNLIGRLIAHFLHTPAREEQLSESHLIQLMNYLHREQDAVEKRIGAALQETANRLIAGINRNFGYYLQAYEQTQRIYKSKLPTSKTRGAEINEQLRRLREVQEEVKDLLAGVIAGVARVEDDR
jgi:GTPase Era involved in 16S rRNA processing